MRNAVAPWSDFDADAYSKVNYATVLPEDEEIIRFATDFLVTACSEHADSPGEWAWQPFWDLMAGLPGYKSVTQPRQRLAAGHDIVHLSIFDLPRNAWDLGTMFFVADGISSDETEFESAVRSFLGALTPGSPFLMAFMEGSAGYDVSGVQFPAVTISERSLTERGTGRTCARTALIRAKAPAEFGTVSMTFTAVG